MQNFALDGMKFDSNFFEKSQLPYMFSFFVENKFWRFQDEDHT